MDRTGGLGFFFFSLGGRLPASLQARRESAYPLDRQDARLTYSP